MNPDRILILTSSLAGGGAEHHILDLCRYLKSVKVNPAVCTLPKKNNLLGRSITEAGIPLYYYHIKSLRDLVFRRNRKKLKEIIEDFQPDIIHAHLIHAEIIAVAASRYSPAPLIATRHSCHIERRGILGLLSKWTSPRFEAVVAVSREIAKDTVDSGYPEERVYFIPNAVDVEKFHPEDEDIRKSKRRAWLEEMFGGKMAPEVIVIGSLGGLKPVKNYRMMVKVACRLVNSETGERVPLRFVLVGEGEERKNLSSLARDLGLEGILALPGFSDRPEKLLPLFDLFFLPSLTEGIPLALLEAMAVGLPCVVSDVGGLREVVGDSGMVIQPENEEEFTRALKRLVVNREEREEMGKMARRKVKGEYSIQPWGENILDVYRNVLIGGE